MLFLLRRSPLLQESCRFGFVRVMPGPSIGRLLLKMNWGKKKNQLGRNPLAIIAFLEVGKKKQAVLILSLSTLLGSNYFHLRMFSVTGKNCLSLSLAGSPFPVLAQSCPELP